MILHADGNSFYASCEQIYRPDLRNKPVVVLSNNDGIIVALNKEAKALGLKRGDVFFKVEVFCQEHDVSVFSSNYTLYADISRRITSIYSEYAPEIEEYSIDESFLFFPKCNWSISDYYEIGTELKNRIWKEVGIPICVGAAPSKTLAKLYNKKAKLYKGVYIYDENEIDKLLQQTPCGEIWGVGPARAETLKRNGINTALELKQMPLDIAKKLLTIQGVATVQELRGIPYIDRVTRERNENITSSRQFSKRLYDIESIECALTQYTQLAVEKLRKQKCESRYVQVHLSTCNYAYEKDLSKCYSNSIIVQLIRSTSYTPDIVEAATYGLRKIFREGFGYKTVMITLLDVREESKQGLLWVDPLEDIKKKNLMVTVDKLTAKYNRNIISLAKGISVNTWQNKRAKLSPCYTTKIQDIPKVF